MNDLTWACHICNEERPDAKISVLKKPLNIPGVISSENIRYCNDKPECVAGAQTFSFYKDSEEDTTDWLSEIRKKNDDYLDTADYMYSEDKERMARVLRELAEHVKELHQHVRVGKDALSDDAKALLKAKDKDDDRNDD